MLTLPTYPAHVSHEHREQAPEALPEDPYRGWHPGPHRIGLAIGFVVTVSLEFLFAWGGNFTHYVPKPVVKEDETLMTIALPKYDQEPEMIENSADRPPQTDALQDMAPPMQTDVPQAVLPESFVQQIEPPPPDVSDLAKNITKIPAYRNNIGNIAVLDVSQLDQIPVPKFRPRPSYPFEMQRQGISGRVIVDFIVDTNGDVRNTVAISSTNPEFEDNAVHAVARWKFTPGRKNNHVVYTHMQVPIVFNVVKDQGGD